MKNKMENELLALPSTCSFEFLNQTAYLTLLFPKRYLKFLFIF